MHPNTCWRADHAPVPAGLQSLTPAVAGDSAA
jgi:hypothetical protein